MTPQLPPDAVLPVGASIPQQPPGMGEILFKALEGFPRFLILFLVDLLHAALSDTMSLALTAGAVLLGLITGSWMVGLAVYMLVFVMVRTVNNLGSATASGGQAVERGLHRVAQVYWASNQPPPPAQ